MVQTFCEEFPQSASAFLGEVMVPFFLWECVELKNSCSPHLYPQIHAQIDTKTTHPSTRFSNGRHIQTIALWRKLKTVALLAFKQEKATTHKHQARGVDVVLRWAPRNLSLAFSHFSSPPQISTCPPQLPPPSLPNFMLASCLFLCVAL